MNTSPAPLSTPKKTKAPYMIDDIVTPAIPDDERLWVPQAENFWFRPLMFNTVSGEWVNVVRIRTSGVISRHRHPAPVHGYAISGSWRYLEHSWVATPGSYVFEPPGEVHTLVMHEGCEEMTTLFHISGALIYIDEDGVTTGFDDVHTKIEMCRKHFAEVGLGEDYVRQFIR